MDQHRLLTFAKHGARFCLRSLWFVLWCILRTYLQSVALLALAFYMWASFGRPDNPHPHYLNWSEYKGAIYEASNHVMSQVYAGGCEQ